MNHDYVINRLTTLVLFTFAIKHVITPKQTQCLLPRVNQENYYFVINIILSVQNLNEVCMFILNQVNKSHNFIINISNII